MTVRTRILEAAAGLLAESTDASTRAVCDAAGVTAPTLYHYFGDKEGLLTAVVDFGWAAFLQTKRTVAAVVHEHIADDDTFATHLREAVIASITVPEDAAPTPKRRAPAAEPTLATAAAILGSKLAAEDTPLTDPERALMQQWLTTLADASAAAAPAPPRRPPQRQEGLR